MERPGDLPYRSTSAALTATTTSSSQRSRLARFAHGSTVGSALMCRSLRSVGDTGPAGAGNARLGLEFFRHVKENSTPVAIWVGRGDPLRAGSAFGLLGQCLRHACSILDGEPIELRREKLIRRVSERVAERDRRRVAEFLGEIIGTPLPDDGAVR